MFSSVQKSVSERHGHNIDRSANTHRSCYEVRYYRSSLLTSQAEGIHMKLLQGDTEFLQYVAFEEYHFHFLDEIITQIQQKYIDIDILPIIRVNAGPLRLSRWRCHPPFHFGNDSPSGCGREAAKPGICCLK